MKNSRRSFMRHLVGACSMLVTGAPKSANGVPSWVPPPKTFAEFTLNSPASVGANVAFLANWCGGTFIRDYGPYGGAAYHGGGEHYSWPDAGGVLWACQLEPISTMATGTRARSGAACGVTFLRSLTGKVRPEASAS